MSIHGCPESWKKGWEEGYLSITWASQLSVFTQNQTWSINTSNTDNKAMYYDVLTTKWPAFQTYIAGPFEDTRVNFKFCFKRASKNAEDTSDEWPEEEFSIYGTNKSCPKGKE